MILRIPFFKGGDALLDSQNRNIDYLRISVTDRCNLRCTYCMPEEGIAPLNHENILSYEEILHLCRCAVQLGICKIKITGGEPLVRSDIDTLISEIKALSGIEQVTLTTNGVYLTKYLDSFVKAGLDGINISLDAMNAEDYSQITRSNAFQEVREGIFQAYEKGFKIKINCVPIRTINDNIAVEIAELARKRQIDIRFIELMPLGCGKYNVPVSQEELIQQLEIAFGSLVPCDVKRGNGPAKYYTLPGFAGKIGFISAVSHMFCNSCNRVRLTSQGFLKLCLQYHTGIDLRGLLRSGASDLELTKAMKNAIFNKPLQHHFGKKGFCQEEENECMYKIGG